MKKSLWTVGLFFVLLFSLLAAGTWAQAAVNCPGDVCLRERETAQRNKPLTVENRFKAYPRGWEVFEDADYGVVVAYPKGWVINTNIDQTDDLRLPLRERALSDSLMSVTISVFDNQGFQTTEEWLKDDEAFYALMDPARITPIKVNGHNGLYYISDDPKINTIDVFIRNVKYVIRLTYQEITNQEADMDIFWHMLKSLRFRDDPVSFVGKTEIPQEVINESYTYLPISLRKLERVVKEGAIRDKPLAEENRTKAFPMDWEFYEDEDNGVVMEYPKDWMVLREGGVSDAPSRAGSLMDTYFFVPVSYFGDDGLQLTLDPTEEIYGPTYSLMVVISVFDNQDFQTVEDWLKDDGPFYAQMDPARITPITIHGHEGRYYISDSVLANYADVFIRNEKYIIRLTYERITNQVADMDTFWRMLKSLNFRDDASFVGRTEIPQEIIDESYTYLPVSNHDPSRTIQYEYSADNEVVKRDKPLTVENRIKAFPTGWEVLADADYGVEMAYPKGWVIWTNIDQNDDLRSPLRDRSFNNSSMWVRLAVFDNRGFRTAEEWLKDDEGFYELFDPARITPITVNGHDGIYYISDETNVPVMNVIYAFIRNEKYLIELRYGHLTNQVADMDSF